MSKASIRQLAVLFLFALFHLPAEAGKHDPIFIPEPIEVPADKNPAEVKKAIRKAFFDEDFEAKDIAPGLVRGKRVKTWGSEINTATIDVHFDSKTIRMGYKDSENLNYDAKDNTIHGTYNKWIRDVERRIRKNLGAY